MTRFSGVSRDGIIDRALSDAIAKAKEGLQTDYIEWELIRVSGRDGGFVLVTDVTVEIDANAAAKDEASETAYFRMGDADGDKPGFVFALNDPNKIAHAQRILDRSETARVHVQGTIVKTPAHYNPGWSFHLDPETIDFFELAVEVCDATTQYVEDNLSGVGGAFLPNCHWCPWTSVLLEEITDPNP